MNFECVYIPIGVGTFHLESAQKEYESSVSMLKEIQGDIKYPSEILLTTDKLCAFLDTVSPDFIIAQNTTFANGAYISEIARRFDCPVLLWALREPASNGGRLRLNSLTGAFSAGNALTSLGRRYGYVFGSPNENAVKSKINSYISAARLKKAMKGLKLLQIGHTPQGFGFGRACDGEMLKNFGVTLDSIEARELIDRAKGYTDDAAADYLEKARGCIKCLSDIPEKNVADFAKLYKAYYEYCAENGVGAIASRCWPDFFTSYGTPVCAVLAMLNDINIPSACEADAYGALTMYAAQFLTGRPAFFGDPVSMDEAENTVTFWHCGTAACSIARQDTGAVAGVHCNRKIGPTLEFGCKPCEKATVLRIGKKPDGNFRIFVCVGEILDKPKQFSGTSLVVKTKSPCAEMINKAVLGGWEPHFAVSYGDISGELEALAGMLSLEVERY